MEILSGRRRTAVFDVEIMEGGFLQLRGWSRFRQAASRSQTAQRSWLAVDECPGGNGEQTATHERQKGKSDLDVVEPSINRHFYSLNSLKTLIKCITTTDHRSLGSWHLSIRRCSRREQHPLLAVPDASGASSPIIANSILLHGSSRNDSGETDQSS